jgi:hypothetical protein
MLRNCGNRPSWYDAALLHNVHFILFGCGAEKL